MNKKTKDTLNTAYEIVIRIWTLFCVFYTTYDLAISKLVERFF